jgi:hypothetical protein
MTISRAGGTDLVLSREQETLLESIFWLALGCALEWRDKECVGRINSLKGLYYNIGREKKSSKEGIHNSKNTPYAVFT